MSDQTDINEDDFGGDDMIAAEFSLGLLTGDAQTQATRRWRTEPSFAGLVEDWDIHFSQMLEDIAPVTPPKGLFRKITNEAYPDSPKGIWQQLGILPAFLGAAAAALVLVLALQFGGLMNQSGPTPTLTAELASEDSSLIVAAAFVEDSGTLFVEWEVGERIPGRDVELWLIAGSDAPVSLGVLNKGTPLTEIDVPEDLRARLAGSVLAVSDEPLGGSPTGAPTGAVLAVGEIATL